MNQTRERHTTRLIYIFKKKLSNSGEKIPPEHLEPGTLFYNPFGTPLAGDKGLQILTLRISYTPTRLCG